MNRDILGTKMIVCGLWIALVALLVGLAIELSTLRHLIQFTAAGFILGTFLGAYEPG